MMPEAAQAAALIRAALDAAAVCATVLTVFLIMEVRKLRMELEDGEQLASRLAAWSARLEKDLKSVNKTINRCSFLADKAGAKCERVGAKIEPLSTSKNISKKAPKKTQVASATFDEAAAEAARYVASFSSRKKRRKNDAKNDASPVNTGNIEPDVNLTAKRRRVISEKKSRSKNDAKNDAKKTSGSMRNSEAKPASETPSWEKLYGTASDR